MWNIIPTLIGEGINQLRFNRAMRFNSIPGQARQWAKAGFSPNMVTEHGGHAAPGIPDSVIGDLDITGMLADLGQTANLDVDTRIKELDFKNLAGTANEIFSAPGSELSGSQLLFKNQIEQQAATIGETQSRTSLNEATETYTEGAKTEETEASAAEKRQNAEVGKMKVKEITEGIKTMRQKILESEANVELMKKEMEKIGYEEQYIEQQIQRLKDMTNNEVAKLALDAKSLDNQILNWAKTRELNDAQIEDIRANNPEGKALLEQMEADGEITAAERATLFIINAFKNLGGGLLIPVK